MFCPKCGTNVPDDQKFCSACGTQIAPAPAPAAPAAPAVPAKKSPVPIYITFALALVLLVLSVVAPLTMNLQKNMLFSEMDLAEDLAPAIAELRLAQGLLPEQQEAVSILLEKLEKLEKNFSLLNFRSAVIALDEYGSVYQPGEDFDMGDLATILDVIIWIIVGTFALPLLFTLLGGLKKSTGLTITAAVFTAIAQLIFSGALLFLASLVVNIVQAVLCSGYKKYQKHLKESTQQL